MKAILMTVTAALVLAGVAHADVPSYRVQFLGAGWTGTGINETGTVCGTGAPDGSLSRAGVSRSGQPFELLPLPAGMLTSRAHDINDAGVIVGAVCPNQYVTTQPTAAVWRPLPGGGYDVQILGGLPGDPYSNAWAVNNVGDIIGASGFWGWNPDHGLLYTASGPVSLPGGMVASDINDSRVIVAGTQLVDLDTGAVTTIPLPAGSWQGVVSAAINNHGDFCGYILGWSGCSTFPIRYRQGTGWEFLGGCATTTSATAMNDDGDALTYYYMTTSGVSFVDHGYFGLGALIAPGEGEYYIQYGGANGINNHHQIVAAARQGFSGPIGAILMTPASVITDVAALPEVAAPRAVPNPSPGPLRLEGLPERLAGGSWGVYDVTGRERARFSRAEWDGTDERGDRVPAGLYFVRPIDRADGPTMRVVIR